MLSSRGNDSLVSALLIGVCPGPNRGGTENTAHVSEERTAWLCWLIFVGTLWGGVVPLVPRRVPLKLKK